MEKKRSNALTVIEIVNDYLHTPEIWSAGFQHKLRLGCKQPRTHLTTTLCEIFKY